MLLEMKHLFSVLRSETEILTFLPILRREREFLPFREEKENLKDKCVFQELKPIRAGGGGGELKLKVEKMCPCL